jgi:integrase/recombinase XerD
VAGRVLPDFVAFMERHRASYVTQALALDWALQPSNVQPAYWAQRLSFVRSFARYCSAIDRRTEIPAQGLLPFQPKRARPYLYSTSEIRALLRAALEMPYRKEREALLPSTYHCLFGLLSVSGMRLGEARNLELQDVDLTAGILTIRGAKLGKTRLVPLHASTCKVLADYIERREHHWVGRPVSSYLFVSSWGNRLDNSRIYRAFNALSRQIGLRGTSDSHGPRLHDMRHYSESRIIPHTDLRGLQFMENTRPGVAPIRNNQRVFEKVNRRSLGRKRGVRTSVVAAFASVFTGR